MTRKRTGLPSRRAPAWLGLALAAGLPVRAAAQEREPAAADVATSRESWTTDADGRRFRVAFDPGSRWLLGGGYATGTSAGDGWAGPAAGQVETALLIRHVVDQPEEESAWKLYHEVLSGRVWLGDLGTLPVPRLDATLYRAAFLRWQRDGFITLPTSPPRRLQFPLNIGLDVTVGRFETLPPATGLAARLELLRSHFLLDAWRSRRLGLYAQFGLGLGYDLWLTGAFGESGDLGVEHLVSPGSDLVAAVRWETDDGRHAVETRGSCGAWWSSERGWGARAETAARYELIWLALNDQPLSAYAEAAYRYESLLDPAAAHEFRATVGLRLGIALTD
ncbi:MAG: hypothetical protein JXB32_12485 [Deltaproteobacteria bacterium]|nr:hypothetical protein [Deltaproteobacteria bacterium]